MANRVGDGLRQAGRDVDHARLSASAGLHEWACLAAHQAAGKAVKALHLLAARPEVVRAGWFGSCAAGREGVGRDLDLVVVVSGCAGPFERRGLLFDCSSLPVPCDLLVHAREEFEGLLARGGRFAEEPGVRAVWIARGDLPGG